MSETIVDRLHTAAKSCDFMALPHNAGTCREAANALEAKDKRIDNLEHNLRVEEEARDRFYQEVKDKSVEIKFLKDMHDDTL